MSIQEVKYLIVKLNFCWKLTINVLRNLADIFDNSLIMSLFMLQMSKTDLGSYCIVREKYLLFNITIK